MKNYLVTHKATIGRDISADNQHPTVHLTFYTLHQAEDEATVEGQIVQYSDPTFRTKVEGVAEVGDTLTIEDIAALLSPKTVLTTE